MTVLSLVRRPIAVNFDHHPSAAQCDKCDSRHLGMCDALLDEDLVFLARVARKMTVSAGKSFVDEGDPARFFYNINSGTVRLFKSLADGRRQITGFMSVGQFLGLSVSGLYAFSAEAMEDVEICRFDRLEMKQIFADFPALERRLLDFTTHELVIAQDQMLLLGRKTAAERVASFLLSWAERQESCPANTKIPAMFVLPLPMTRMDMADCLGLTLETVSRALNQMKRDGLIDLSKPHEVVIIKPRHLRKIADGEVLAA
jgi:CRP/FNR family transcriptional regulator